MTKEKHFSSKVPHKLVDRLWLWQKNLRLLTSLVPAARLPLLTPAQAYGPDIERFREPSQSLVSWWDKQSQSWSFRGNLITSRGHRLGFQLTFVDRHTQNDFFGAVPARWIRPRAFAAHFSISDPMNGDATRTFCYWQHGGLLSAANGFAADDRFHVELGGWHAFKRDDGTITVFANGDGDSVYLELSEDKPLAYHGQAGYTQKDQCEAGASFYCSLPRLKTTGRVLLDGKLEDVTGMTWMDHEKNTAKKNPWGTSWDRLALQFTNGHDLMILALPNQTTSGSWIAPDGTIKHLISSDIKIENYEYWISPRTQARYPIKRRIVIESLDLNLDVRASLANQELDLTRSTFAAQWEGAVNAGGHYGTTELDGHGFMELVGYDSRPRARVFEFLTKN